MRRNWGVRLAGVLAALLFGGVIASQAVTEPQNDFHFSIVGDRTGGAHPGVYSRVWREIDLLGPDFVINVGDTIEGMRDDTAESQWEELQPLFDRYRKYPLYFTPGNHDVYSETSRRVYEKETGRPVCYSFDYQQAHFTVLDNSRTEELSEDQLRFLEKDLAAHQDRDPKFVFFHRPFWLVPVRLHSGEFALHRLARKYGVDYVISGHGHFFARLERDGIVYLEVGSSGGHMRGQASTEGFRGGWFYHHVWATVKGTDVKLMVKEVGPPFGEGRMFPASDWGENGPEFDVEDPAAGRVPDL